MPSHKLDAKIVIVGASYTGKTSTMLRFIKDSYKDSLPSTIGASYLCKTIVVKNVRIKLQIWDSAGQEQYYSLVGMYFRKASAVILMYDISSTKTFNDMKIWKKEIENNAPEDVIICVVGNKCDLDQTPVNGRRREVTVRQGKQYAKSIGALFVETSAKENIGITELFQMIGEELVERNKGKLEIDTSPEPAEYTDDRVNMISQNADWMPNESPSAFKKRCCRQG